MRFFYHWIFLLLTFLSLSACSASNQYPAQTASQLSPEGKTIYLQNCAHCHGEDGQKVNGSALIGADNVLANYQTAKGLYDYISKMMPDDKPGGLTPTQYLQVESYLLAQNGFVKPETRINLNSLENLLLKK